MRIRKPKKAVLRKRASQEKVRTLTSRQNMFVKLIEAIKKAKAEEREIGNRNNFYAMYGFAQTSPIYIPQRKKMKGYQKHRTTFNKNR